MKRTLKSLQRIAPALEISQTSGGETNGGGRLRGLGTGVFNPSVASSVAFVVDQVPVGNLAFPQLFDLAQVEVLRGPAYCTVISGRLPLKREPCAYGHAA
jgi:iron complex outermembrane recepter protein